MVELAVIKSHTGADAQQLHTDATPRKDTRDAKLWTVFMPLQTISGEMGALQVYSCPGTQIRGVAWYLHIMQRTTHNDLPTRRAGSVWWRLARW